MDTIKYQVNGIFEIIFGCLSDIINSITSFFDYLLIEREFVVVCLLFIMFVIAVPIAVYLWGESKAQKIKFFKSFILMILSFVIIIFSYIGISYFYINSNLTTETDKVVLVEKGIKDSKVFDDGDFRYATNGVKFIGERGYSVTWFNGKNASYFRKASFHNNIIKGTSVNIDGDVYEILDKLEEHPKNIRLKYLFYKKGSRIPRMIVVESE